jgi:hypothetical protein
MLVGPIVIAKTGFIAASAFRLSFSRYLMAQDRTFRMLVFALFVLVTLAVAAAAGRTVAFLEFMGLLRRPEIVITYNDGKTLDVGGPLYLVARADSMLYVARKSTDDGPVKTWMIPQGGVRHIELRPAESETLRLFDYFK